MKKAYSLNYSIESDVDRNQAVIEILDALPEDPKPTDLEQMGTYILCGKDSNGFNAIQRGEIYLGNQRRFNSFKTAEDKVISLDEVLENPMSDQQALKPATQRYAYIKKKPGIRRPKYARDGTLLDIGDGDIPGIQNIWDSIDRLEHWIAILEKKIPPDEIHQIIEVDSYRLYQLKHQLIDLRRHQYYLKDIFKPTLYFVGADRPKAQFINWAEDSAYWMPLDQWQRKVARSLLSSVSKNLEDYETRTNQEGNIEVHWIVRRHIFDWENPNHIRALIVNYDLLYNYFKDKLDTYGRTLIFDFERYVEMASFSELRAYILQCKIRKMSLSEILTAIQIKFGISYNVNHLGTIINHEIPERIAETAKKHRLLLETPKEQMKKCYKCGRYFPRDNLFFTHNRSRKDGLSSNCKECDRKMRMQKKGGTDDGRAKDSKMSEMPTR